jgi:CheY-like chemotaxis protein
MNNQTPETPLLHGVNILLVEDSDMNRLVASTMLHNHGATVYEATNGQQAVEAMEKTSCDLILMDIQMPVMDGRKAAKMIRKNYHTSLPIIALTANAVKKETDKCIAAGMNDCIAKPFEEEELIKLISKWLGKGPLYSLHKLQHTGRGNADFVQKMIRLFIVQVPAGVQEIKSAYAAGSFAVVAATAHRIEPILNNFCIGSLKDKIAELEYLALRRKPLPRLEVLISQIEYITTQVADDLQIHHKLN